MSLLRRFVRVPTPSMIVAVAALLVATSGAALAAIPDTSGVIHGCMNNRTGALRVIDSEAPASETCTSKETPLNWNQTGPAGPAGSVSATYQRSVSGTGGNIASCDAGDFATGGGGLTSSGAVKSSVPISNLDDVVIGWLFQATDPSASITAYVVCADATP